MSGPATPDLVFERWRRAILIRDEWLDCGLSTSPADRPSAEAAVTELYALAGVDRPRFVWVDSPGAALAAGPDDRASRISYWLRAASAPGSGADWPVAAKLATLMSVLRQRLDARVGRRWESRERWWRGDPRWALLQAVPQEALLSGAPLADLLNVAVQDSLRESIRDSLFSPLQATLTAAAGDSLGIAWHGQHDAYWVAHFDVRRRLGMTAFSASDNHQLDQWAALARSSGWWWPYETLCVMSERPAVVHTEPVPGRRHKEFRLHCPHGPAVTYTDGWSTHAWHGTRVPAWVIADPTAERIAREPNVEVRRCAIERIGWDTYIDQAGLHLVAVSADPGNPGNDLHLYEVPRNVWGAPARVLLAVNGSVERDGHRRRYGLSVPPHINDPVAAAGWSYGLSGTQYARMLRRT